MTVDTLKKNNEESNTIANIKVARKTLQCHRTDAQSPTITIINYVCFINTIGATSAFATIGIALLVLRGYPSLGH